MFCSLNEVVKAYVVAKGTFHAIRKDFFSFFISILY